MSNIETDVNSLLQGFIRIGFDTSSSVINALSSFFDSYRSNKQKQELEDYQGKIFTDKDAFTLENKKDGNQQVAEITVPEQNKEIKLLKKLAKARGVDIYLEKRPKNLENLFQTYRTYYPKDLERSGLTAKEIDLVKAFTIVDKTGLSLKNHGMIVQFKSSDLDIMNEITKELEQSRVDIHRRMLEAENRKQDKQEKKKEKAKEKSKSDVERE